MIACKTSPTNETSESKFFQNDSLLSEFKKIEKLDYRDAKYLGLGEEYIPPNEASVFAEYANLLGKMHSKNNQEIQSKRPQSINYRGMHAKGHGCLEGTIEYDNPRGNYLSGIFKNTKTYAVVARFSNGSSFYQADSERDLLGLAIKVKNVTDGKRLIKDGKDEQDFLMTSAPHHHTRDIHHLMNFIFARASGRFQSIKFPDVLAILLKQTHYRPENALTASYWSRAPFKWGEGNTVKYFVKPCNESREAIKHSKLSDDHYIEKISDYSSTRPTCFNMYVQPQTDAYKEPIENHQIEWKSPAEKIAKIVFPIQNVDRSETCQSLKFSPWNGIFAHKGLGNFNRARRLIYDKAASLR